MGIKLALNRFNIFCNSRVPRPRFAKLVFYKMIRHTLLAIVRTLPPLAVRRIATVSLLWLAGSFSPAMAGAHSTSGSEIKPAVIYHNYCSVCHGDKGDGRSRAQNSLNPPPRNFTTPDAAQLSRARMIEAVTNGRSGTAMTAWKTQLNPKEIESVVDYVRNNFMMSSTLADGSRGRIVYSKNCSVCHGEKGDGRSRAQGSLNPPPRDFTSAAAKTDLSIERMITSVTYGRADTAMAGFKTQLSKEDISAVVDYIRAGFMGESSTQGISGINHGRRQSAPDGSNAMAAASMPAGHAHKDASMAATGHVHKATTVNMSAPMPQGLKGDAAKGNTFYMNNCATCHGKTGDGRGPRAYFINPKPRNFLHPASRQELNRIELFEMISEGRPGTEMPAWNKVLSRQEIADVAEFVYQRFIRPAAESGKQAKAAE